MKKLILLAALLFSANIQSAECLFSWDASVSTDVTHYNLYQDGVIYRPNINGLNIVVPCEIGSYTMTAVNRFDIESDPTLESETLTIKKPAGTTGLSVSAQ